MIGNVIFDLLTVPTIDEERNVTYPAWTVCRDKKLQISSDAVMNDKIQRSITQDAEEVIVPIAGTSEINSNMHLSLQTNLKNKNIFFLSDDAEYEYKISSSDPNWILLSSEQRAEILAPFLDTRLMINESVSLNTEYKGGIVRVKEDRSATKDRYMTLAMFNYFGEKLKTKLLSEEDEDEFDIGDWKFLSN